MSYECLLDKPHFQGVLLVIAIGLSLLILWEL